MKILRIGSRRSLYAAGFLAAVLVLSGPAIAHLDPPGPPAIKIVVKITGAASTGDEDDGNNDNAELSIFYRLTHVGHTMKPVEGGLDVAYDWDTSQGALKDLDKEIYNHTECSPMNRIHVVFFVSEEEPFADGVLGNGTELGTGQFNTTLSGGEAAFTITTMGAHRRPGGDLPHGVAKVRYTISVTPTQDRC